jgi:hypothetical protein
VVAEGVVYPPPLNVTEPVGVAVPAPPLTAMATDSGLVTVMLEEPGVTVTAGAAMFTVRLTEPVTVL